MPIEFRCPSCARTLRTPDETAGKSAKCPQCGTITEVPSSSTTGTPSGSMGGFSSGPTGGGPAGTSNPFGNAANPYATPQSGGMGLETKPFSDDGNRSGLPWDLGPRSLSTYWETAKLVFGGPTQSFRSMARDGGLGIPIFYALIGGLIGGFFSGIYNTVLQALLPQFIGMMGAQGNPPPGMQAANWIQVVLALPLALIGGTIGTLIGLFIGSGINHVFLMLVGGAKMPFETTFRVVAYVQGTVALLQVVPLCGQYVSGLIALVYLIIGFAEAHQISTGRSAAAVLIQFAICALVIGGIVAIAIVGVAAANAR